MSIDNPIYVKHALEKADLKLAMVLIAATEARTRLLSTVFELLSLNAQVDDETTGVLLNEYAPPLKESLNHMGALIQEIGDSLFADAGGMSEEEMIAHDAAVNLFTQRDEDEEEED